MKNKQPKKIRLLSGNYVKLPKPSNGFCNLDNQEDLIVYELCGASDYEPSTWLCIDCIKFILSKLKVTDTVLNCRKCEAILLDDKYYKEPDAFPYCWKCEPPLLTLERNVSKHGPN